MLQTSSTMSRTGALFVGRGKERLSTNIMRKKSITNFLATCVVSVPSKNNKCIKHHFSKYQINSKMSGWNAIPQAQNDTYTGILQRFCFRFKQR